MACELVVRVLLVLQLSGDSAEWSGRDAELARPLTAGEEELQLQLALAMSREEADRDERRRRSDDVRLQLAISQSQQDFQSVPPSHYRSLWLLALFLYCPPPVYRPVPQVYPSPVLPPRLEAYLREEEARLHSYKAGAVVPVRLAPIPEGRGARGGREPLCVAGWAPPPAPPTPPPRCWFYGCIECLRPNVIQSVPNSMPVLDSDAILRYFN